MSSLIQLNFAGFGGAKSFGTLHSPRSGVGGDDLGPKTELQDSSVSSGFMSSQSGEFSDQSREERMTAFQRANVDAVRLFTV